MVNATKDVDDMNFLKTKTFCCISYTDNIFFCHSAGTRRVELFFLLFSPVIHSCSEKWANQTGKQRYSFLVFEMDLLWLRVILKFVLHQIVILVSQTRKYKLLNFSIDEKSWEKNEFL